MGGILTGTRVVDFGRYVAGPYCATLLGYLGADVIRVEKPDGGEDRYIAPIASGGEGGVFFQTACNKRSLTLNFRSEHAMAIVRRLVERSDVIVANLPPTALQRMGLDWQSVNEINPRAILSTQTAFGTEGPWSDRGGFDGVGQSMSGAAYMTGTPGAPVKAAAPYVDFSTAVLSAFGVLAALLERENTGRGRHVEATLLTTALSVFASHLIEEGATGIGRTPSGNRVQTSGPSDLFATRDGFVLIHVVGRGIFERCARLIGAEEWLDDEGLARDQDRGNRRDELCERVGSWCAQRTTEEALAEFHEAGVPAGPVLNLHEALTHPQTLASGLFRNVDWPDCDQSIPVPGLPLKFDEPQPGPNRRPPQLGEHTDVILGELGYSEAEVRALHQAGAV